MPFEVTTLYRDRTENQTEQARLHREEDERFEKAQKSEDTNFKDAKKAEDQRFAEVITKAESQFTATMDQADRNRRTLRQMSFSAGIVPPQNDPGVVSIKQGIVDFLASEGGPPSMGSQVASNWSVIHPVAYEGGSPFGLATVEVPDSSELYPKAESALRVLLGFIQISLDFSRQPNREKAVRAGSMGTYGSYFCLELIARPSE